VYHYIKQKKKMNKCTGTKRHYTHKHTHSQTHNLGQEAARPLIETTNDLTPPRPP
jgi:hypothetical protein